MADEIREQAWDNWKPEFDISANKGAAKYGFYAGYAAGLAEGIPQGTLDGYDAALAAVPGRHPLHRLARAQDAAGDVDRHHLLDALGRHLVDAHAALADASPTKFHNQFRSVIYPCHPPFLSQSLRPASLTSAAECHEERLVLSVGGVRANPPKDR